MSVNIAFSAVLTFIFVQLLLFGMSCERVRSAQEAVVSAKSADSQTSTETDSTAAGLNGKFIEPASYLENPSTRSDFAVSYVLDWEYKSSRCMYSTPLLNSGEDVYCVDTAGNLHIIAQQDLSARVIPLDQRPLEGGTLAGDRYYSVDRDNTITCLSNTGEEVWQFAAHDEVVGYPAVSQSGKVLVSFEAGRTIRLDKNGVEEWRHDSLFPTLSPATFVAGTTYAARWVPIAGLILLDEARPADSDSIALSVKEEAVAAQLVSAHVNKVIALDTTGTLHSFTLSGESWSKSTSTTLSGKVTVNEDGSIYLVDYNDDGATVERYNQAGELQFEVVIGDEYAAGQAIVDAQGKACVALQSGEVFVVSQSGQVTQAYSCELLEGEYVTATPGCDEEGNLYLATGINRGAGRVIRLSPAND